MSDTGDKIQGKAKEMTGKVTGNRKLEMKGKFQHDSAELRQKAKRTADDVADKL